VLVSGRALAVYRDLATEQSRVVGEIQPGEMIGEMGMLTGEPRSTSVVCWRDSEVLSLDRQAFERIISANPRALMAISQAVIQRQRRQITRGQAAATSTVSTVSILPAGGDDGASLGAFSELLAAALGQHGVTRHVSVAQLPPGISEALTHGTGDLRMRGWLDELERVSRFVILQADPAPTQWSEWYIRQADRILLVAQSNSPPGLGRLEQQAQSLGAIDVAIVQQDLVLLQPAVDRLPIGTGAWLKPRVGQVHGHHHVHLGTPATVERVARFIAGRAIGLALGGGGARGFAHIGVIRALREAGVPVDVVAGTSMGSVIGAECALGWSVGEMNRRNRHAFIDQHPLRDYTLPMVAANSGRAAARMLRGLFGEVEIEDLWSTYVAISSNMTRASVAAHSTGLLRKYVRASIAVPGILPPVAEGGELLVDGGVLNNVPADIVRGLVGTGSVIAVDVNPREGLHASEDYGEILNGWEVAWRRFSPLARALEVPTIYDVLERMTMLGSIHQAAMTVQPTADLYLHPPTDMVRFLDFSRLDEHAQRGYEFARPLVDAWAQRSGNARSVRWSTG